MKKLFCVQWGGQFGFIKPFCAVRDDKIYSQQFLTESIISGMEMKLFPELLEYKNGYDNRKIVRHRLMYQQMVLQQEVIQSAVMKNGKRETSIVTRGVMINPVLTLAFDDEDSAVRTLNQHLFLCRNEDIIYPTTGVIVTDEEKFDKDERFRGFELIHGLSDESILVGFNRFKGGEPMYGKLIVVGDEE